jgi:hypothetical protein
MSAYPTAIAAHFVKLDLETASIQLPPALVHLR